MMTVLGLVVAAPGGVASASPDRTAIDGVLASTGIASATATATFTRTCAEGTVRSMATNNPIRVSPSITSTVLQWAPLYNVKECLLGYYTLGDRYTACGVSNANGWIKIWVPTYGWGYGYMTCWEDY
ncbi:hypothetical protein PSN13_02800 [Micromonospora saelicesensis]|uniref:SH3b domain-containing protein n=1 Tax=Micromonospora saelicesensis TaxID=285676 RepID=A0A328NPS7_9ACTN|nr:hypothetical protein PSN13_02800 [Micromonospora saelicesensis]